MFKVNDITNFFFKSLRTSSYVFFTETFQSITSNEATKICNIFKPTMKIIYSLPFFKFKIFRTSFPKRECKDTLSNS